MKQTMFLGLALMYAIPLSAQTDTIALGGEVILDELQVKADLRPDTENSETISQASINESNTGQQLPYLFQQTPNVSVTSDDGLGVGYTYFHIRGTEPTRINTTINQVPLNDSEDQTVFWVNLTDLAADAQKIDIQRGVGSSKHGSSAFGASVNITGQTLMNEDSSQHVHAEIGFQGGMYNTFREMAKLHIGIGEWQISGRASKVNSDGYLERAKSDLFSYQGQIGWHRAKTTVQLIGFGGKEKTYMAWYGATREQIEQNRRYNPAGEYMNEKGEIQYYDNQTDCYQQHHLQLHVRHSFNRHWSMTAIGHYTYGKGYYEMADYATCLPTGELDGVIRKGLQNHFYGGIVQSKYISEKADVEIGTALNNYQGWHIGKIYQGLWNDLYLGRGRKTDGNIFAKALWRVWRAGKQAFSIYGDLQYRMIDYSLWGDNDETYKTIDQHHQWHFFNPKAGLNYENGAHQLYATFAIANREPARTNFTGAYGEMPKAERLYDYELGYGFQQTKRLPWRIGANLYFMDYDNQLIPTGQLNDVGAAVTENVKDSYRIGIELTGQADWTSWLQQNANLSLSRNQWRNAEGGWQTISFSPSVVFNHRICTHYHGLNIQLETQVIGKQYLDNSENNEAKLRAYSVSNLMINYTLPLHKQKAGQPWPNITLLCRMNNLFNAKYENNGGCVSWTDETGKKETGSWYNPQAGFHIHAGVNIVF